MKHKRYFESPTQVKFRDEDGIVCGGIAFCNVIICGCCGGVIKISDLDKIHGEDGDWLITTYEDTWEDLTDTILGEDSCYTADAEDKI